MSTTKLSMRNSHKVHEIYEEVALTENAVPLAEFLSISNEKARAILALDHLFSD
jgi:hypothetical protein